MINNMFIENIITNPCDFVYDVKKNESGKIIKITARKKESNRGIIINKENDLTLFLACANNINYDSL